MDTVSTMKQPSSFASIDRTWVLVPATALMLIFLQFQTLPIRIQVQTLPVTTVLGLLTIPFIIRAIPRSPLAAAVALFGAYAIVHSIVALTLDMISPAPEVRFISWMRQTFGLLSGILLFFVLRQGFLHISFSQFFKWVTIGFIPPVILSLLNIGWGALGMTWAGAIVEAVRDVVAPEGYTSPLRASGFTNEPSAWATSIVLTAVPAILYYYDTKRHPFTLFIFFVCVLLSFTWTFSTIGLMLILSVLLSGVVVGPRRSFMVTILVAFLFFLIGAVVLFPQNQVIRHATVLLAGKTNISFNDRFYGIVGPFVRYFESWSSAGYGLGGVSTHFRELIPAEYAKEILDAQWEGLPNITIIIGRIFAETGAVGFVLFLTMLVFTFRELALLRRFGALASDRRVYDIMRLTMIAVVVSLLVAIGPYQTPFLWLYMALVDASFIRERREGGLRMALETAGGSRS